MILAIDFDGTLVHEAWPDVGDWLPRAKETLARLARDHKVIVWTCRTAPVNTDGSRRSDYEIVREVRRVREKLAECGEEVEVWTHPFKPRADFYIDDRALRFTGDWFYTLREMEKLRGK